MNRKNRKQRDKLYALNPNCHWCGVRMNPPPHDKHRPKPDDCTVDHLYPVGHPDRKPGRGDVCRVLACHRCNQQRGIEWNRRLKAEKTKAPAEQSSCEGLRFVSIATCRK